MRDRIAVLLGSHSPHQYHVVCRRHINRQIIDLSGNRLTDAHLKQFSGAVARMPLESLDLSGNCFTVTGCEALFKGHGLERLKVLHLSFNALEGLRSDHLSTLFRKSPRLHELGLESCGLSASIIVAALRMKAAGTTLALSLSNNPLLIEALELQHLCEKTASLDISNSTFDSGLLGQSSAAGAAAALARGSNVGSNGGAVLMSGTKCSLVEQSYGCNRLNPSAKHLPCRLKTAVPMVQRTLTLEF